ncbi:hypothetical protein AKJ16_DCAP16730 [Drosera capensis]
MPQAYLQQAKAKGTSCCAPTRIASSQDIMASYSSSSWFELMLRCNGHLNRLAVAANCKKCESVPKLQYRVGIGIRMMHIMEVVRAKDTSWVKLEIKRTAKEMAMREESAEVLIEVERDVSRYKEKKEQRQKGAGEVHAEKGQKRELKKK